LLSTDSKRPHSFSGRRSSYFWRPRASRAFEVRGETSPTLPGFVNRFHFLHNVGLSDQFTYTAKPRVQHAFQAIEATVSYGGVPVLHGVSLDIPTGRTTAVLGPNGSGKSTLMRAMLGIVPLDRGEIRVHGTPLRRFRDWRRIGYVP